MMYWLVWLLFGFRGRIPRKSYWLAQAILQVPAVAGVTGYLMINGLALPQPGPAGPLSLIWTLALLFPAFAVVVKRLNDRGHPSWVAAIWLGLACAAVALGAFIDPLADPINWGRGEWAALTIFIIVGIWFVIDLGILRGQRGPNRHGPDPLGVAGDVDTMQSAVQRRRSLGENIRDAVTGVALLIAVFAFAGWNFGIAELSGRAFTWLLTESFEAWEKRRAATDPAFRAEREGHAASKARNYDEAVRHFSRAVELYGPDSATAWLAYFSRAFALQQMGRAQEALSDYNKSVALWPDFTGGYRYRGILFSELGQHEDALKDFATALRQNPNSGATLVARGQTLEKIGRREEALADYTQAITASHNFYDKMIATDSTEQRKRTIRDRDDIIVRAQVKRGNIYSQQGRDEAALAEYGQALELRPDDGWIYVNRGWLHENQGRLDLAGADYEKAASLTPPDDWLKRALERTR